MNLTDDAMQVSLRITACSMTGSTTASRATTWPSTTTPAASAGRYNKRLLPKAAFAALDRHHERRQRTDPLREHPALGRPGKLAPPDRGQLRALHGAAGRAGGARGARARPASSRTMTATSIRPVSIWGSLFRIEDYPSKEALRDRFSIALPDRPRVQDADHFMAELADRRHRAGQARHRAPDRGAPPRRGGRPLPAPRRGGRARVRAPAARTEKGKPLVFRDSA